MKNLIKKMKNYYYLIIALFVFARCSNSVLTPDEIYEKYRKSVVLIKSNYYFEIEFSGGTKLYFTELANGEIIGATFSEDEILENQNTSTGSGFFISSDGRIATNDHLINPQISYEDDYDLNEALKSFFTDNYDLYVEIVNSHVEQIDFLDSELQNSSLSLSEINNIKNERNVLYDSYLFWNNLENNGFDFNDNNTYLGVVKTKLGIAYDNTYVTNDSDLKDCIELTDEIDFSHDLSIIQLKDKKTPSFVNNFVNINEIKEKKLKVNSLVYMIGFNSGFDIGITKNGLSNQITQGTISQVPDKDRVLYSIPTLPGSSGSPVLDENGDLIAINYAGMTNTQGFNYGVLSKHLIKLNNLLK